MTIIPEFIMYILSENNFEKKKKIEVKSRI
jgi:hypothetical protein